MYIKQEVLIIQGRRRVLKSGTATERHRRSAKAEGTSRGFGTSRGRAREGNFSPLVRRVRGISPEKIFEFKMSVEAILLHFETMFVCEIRLIVKTFHIAVFKRISNATNKEYLHFLCESLNEPLHLPNCSYFMNNIASRDVTWHPWMRAIWAYQRQGHPITLFVY